MDKQSIRNDLIHTRSGLPADDVRDWSRLVAERARTLVNWQAIGSLHSYTQRMTWNEPDTAWVEAHVYTMWPNVMLTMEKTLAGTPVPTTLYDVIFVPVLGFDESCNRLGMGGGWYDRFLRLQPQSVKIGLTFESQFAPHLKTVIERHDVPLDMIVTEKRVIMKSASHQSPR